MTVSTVLTTTASPLFMILLLLLRAGRPDSSAVFAAPSPAPGNDTATAASAHEVTCESDADCRRLSFQASTVGIGCDTSTHRCVCSNRTLVLTRRGTCLPIRMLGQPCRRNEQCLKIDKNSECDDDFCKCRDGFFLFNDINGTYCLPDVEVQTMNPYGLMPKDHALSEENMVPIIVCLAIMFVGMCVALQLFSRARFRNQRTIFNTPNPRLTHLKTDSKRRQSHTSLYAGSRRASACSQLSPSKMASRVGSRSGSRAGSRTGSPDVRRSSVFQHHGEQHHGERHGSKDGGHTLIARAAESIQNGSPKVIVNRGRSPSPPAQA